MYSLLREKASLYENALIQFASELVSIPANQNFKDDIVGDTVISTMNSLGYDKAFKDSFGNVAGCIFGRDYSPTLLLVSHMDTFNSPSVNSDTKVRIDENNIYGFGASDSKGALAAQVFAGRLIKECIPMFGNIIVVGTVAELDGCSAGIRYFLKDTLPTLGLNASFAILGEPTDLGLYYCHDGWVSIELKITGQCLSDIERASIELYNFLNKSSANALNDSEKVEEIQIAKPQILSVNDSHNASIRIMHRLRNKNELLHLLCRFRETVRLVCRPYTSVSASAGISRKVIQSKEGGPLVVRQLSLPWATDPLNPYFEEARLALRAASCEIRGGNLPCGRLGMSSAGNVLTDMYNIPTIGYGPGKEEILQGSDDYMTIDNLKEAFYGTAVIANRITGMPSVNKTEKNV